MAGMWTLGGIPPRELLRRTARESWKHDVFGQAARLAFYNFLAIFPVLLLLLIPLARLAGAGIDMRTILTGSLRQFLPADAAALVAAAIQDLNSNAHDSGGLLIVAASGAIWAGFNASWAMIAGLNLAYDTEEDRRWFEVAARAGCLAITVVALVMAALFGTHYIGRELAGPTPGRVLPRIAQWGAIITILMISFAVFYRFGPNLKEHRWQWSTPGAVFGTMLWVASTLLVQEYFDRFASHYKIYGRLAATAALMMWLYVTSATILIGAELNSEIEKDGEKSGAERAARKQQSGAEKPV
jgi:membrane protein